MSPLVGVLTAVCLVAALFAVSVSNIVHAIFALALTLLGLAGLFLTLDAPFVAAMEVLIYIGGISVAMVFAVMLSHAIGAPPQPERPLRRVLGAVPALLFGAALAALIVQSDFQAPPTAPPPEAWGLPALGRALLQRYNLVFETLSAVLLLAIVGAIALARRLPDDPREEAPR